MEITEGGVDVTMLIGQQHWWQDCGEISALLRWLHESDEYGPLEMSDAVYIVSKPWKWGAEYQEMLREREAGGPKEEPAIGEEMVK